MPYESDIEKPLPSLRKREFEAGRYNPAVMFPKFPVTADSPSPGVKHRSIAEALQASDADGTCSILDMERVLEMADFGVVVPLLGDYLTNLYGIHQPSRAMPEENMDFTADIERGNGIYIVIYDQGKPSEICFAGYSYE